MEFFKGFFFLANLLVRVLAVFGGLIALVAALWLTCTTRGENLRHWLRIDEECRCRSCEKGDFCSAAFSSVRYPCAHYKVKDKPRK